MDRPSKIAFVDTETTGLSHLSRPWEIGIVLREDMPDHENEVDGVPTTESEYVFHVDYLARNLPDGTEPMALQVGRWSERGSGVGGAIYRETVADQGVYAAQGPEWTIARKIWDLLEGATMVGVGIHYDAEVLGRMFLRHGLPWQPWHYDIRDLKTMTRGFIAGARSIQVPPVEGLMDPLTASSDELASWASVRPPTADERHTALGDARWAARWWDAL